MKREIEIGTAFVSNDRLEEGTELDIRAFLRAVSFNYNMDAPPGAHYEATDDGVLTELNDVDYKFPAPGLTKEQLEPWARLHGENRIMAEVRGMIETNRKELEKRIGDNWTVAPCYSGWCIYPKGMDVETYRLTIDHDNDYFDVEPHWADLRRAIGCAFEAGIETGEENVKASLRKLLNVEEAE